MKELKSFVTYPRYWFGQAIMGGFLKYFSIFFALALTCYIVVWLLSMYCNGKYKSDFSLVDFVSDAPFWANLRGIGYLFLDPGYLYYHAKQPPEAEILGLVIAVLGMVLVNGLLISLIVGIILRVREDAVSGRVVYKKVRDHAVLVGFGEIGMSILRHILNEDKGKQLKYVLIYTQQDTEQLRSLVKSQLSASQFSKVIFYSGKFESRDEFVKLNLPQTKLIYVLGEDGTWNHDVRNIIYLQHIAAMLSDCIRNRRYHSYRSFPRNIEIRVQYDALSSSGISQKLNSLTNVFEGFTDRFFPIDIQSFSFHENWARLLWSSYGIWSKKKTHYLPLDQRVLTADKAVHLIIIGFNRMGRALLLEALRVCHYLDQKQKTRITIFDKQMDELLPSFEASYPYIAEYIKDIDVEYRNKSVGKREARGFIDSIAKDSNQLLTIAVCVQDADTALDIGMNLPESVYYVKDCSHTDKEEQQEAGKSKSPQMTAQVLIRQDIYGGISELIDNNSDRYKNVKIFGMLDTEMDADMMDDRVASFINYRYTVEKAVGEMPLLGTECEGIINSLNERKHECDKLWQGKLNEARHEWLKINELMRWANRYQVDCYDYYMRCYRQENVTTIEQLAQTALNNLKNPNPEKEGDFLEKLANLEHRRWMAERAIAGWRQKDSSINEPRSNAMLVHDTMIPYAELSPTHKNYDRNAVLNAFIICQVIGRLPKS